MKALYIFRRSITFTITTLIVLLFANHAKANCNFNAGFTFSSSSANCKQINFTNTSYVTNSNDSGVSYLWYNGNSIFASTRNASYTFPSNGTYAICLIMFKQTAGVLCSDTACQTITINCNSGGTGCTWGNIGWEFSKNCTNKTIQFKVNNSDSTGYYKYKWSFGDGTYDTTNQKMVSHAYGNITQYTACLNIKKYLNGNVCKDTTICKVVSVTAPLKHSNFTISSGSSCSQLSFNINDSNNMSGNACAIYRWFWGDGTTSIQTSKYPVTHTYANNGVYNVCLKTMACYDTTCYTMKCLSGTVYCNNNTNCSIYGGWTFNVSCPTRVVSFAAFVGDTSGIYSYSWNYGDSTNPGGAKNVTHTYAANGTYYVCLKIKRFTSSNATTPCRDTIICKTITVNCNSNTNCSLYGNWTYSVACPSKVMTFSSYVGDTSGSYAYLWEFGDNTTNFSGKNGTHTFANNGNYTVCLKIKRFIPGTTTVCKDTTICKTVAVNCNSTQCNLTAGFNFGINCALKKLEVTNTTTGDSCFYSTWNFGDNTGNVNTKNPGAHVYAQAGTYQVCLIVKKCSDTTCVKYICKTVVIPPNCCNSKAYFGAALNCAAKKVEVINYSYGDSCMTYKWSWGDGSYSTAKNPGHHVYSQPGTYNVCLKVTKCNDTTCVNTFCKTIVIPAVCCPTPNFYFYKFCNTYRFINTTSGGTSYWWSFGDSSFSSAKNPYHTFFSKRTFQVCLTVFDSVKHCSTTVCKNVTVNCNWFGGGHHFETPLDDRNMGDEEKVVDHDMDLTPARGLQMNEKAGISAYPNPTNSALNIVLPAENSTVKITSVAGAVLMQFDQVSSFCKVDVSKLAAGVYFVNVINENGVQSVRFMKE